MFYPQQTAERFWNNSIPEPNTGCRLWLGHTDAYGYGRVRYRSKHMLAHRLSWLLTHGSIDAPCVLHRCDTPQCVNPDHLFLGTKLDNNADRVRKGRSSRAGKNYGERNGRAKLTADAVCAIRAEKYRRGLFTELGRRFGVSCTTVSGIHKRERWRSL